MRKLAWLLGIITVVGVILIGKERRRVRQEAQLWAEATDPLP